MAKKSQPKKLHSWTISRIRGTPAALVGIVEAPDEEATIKKAIEEFQITNPAHQQRPMARRRE